MKKIYILVFLISIIIVSINCSQKNDSKNNKVVKNNLLIQPDTSKIGNDEFGKLVNYGRELMLHTVQYIGPNGIAGAFTKTKMNCTNCHQDAGTKPYSFNLMQSHIKYPQYRPREGRVLTLADRVNNCIERPLSGKPLPLESKEMIAFLCYLKWINNKVNLNESKKVEGYENLEIKFIERAADPEKGKLVYEKNCTRCHGINGEGKFLANNSSYEYPPLWGENGYQAGSSMHRVVKQARWIKANMPNDLAKWFQPILTDEECLDVAAFINDGTINKRPDPKNFDYPNIAFKNIDYDKGPYIDTFSAAQHKFGPWQPIIDYWKQKGWKPVY